MVMRHDTALALVEEAFSTHSNKVAYSCMGQSLVFNAVDELSLRFAQTLHHTFGLRPGDRLAVQLPNILQFPVVMYGAMRAGLIIVNLNPLYTEREIEQQLSDSGASALVVLSNVALNASKVVARTQVKHVIVTDVADLHAAPKRWLIHFVSRYVKRLVPHFSFESSVAFRDCLMADQPPLPNITVTPSDVMMLQYTGGTTGTAKGAMLTQHNIASNVWQLITLMPEAFEGSNMTYLTCLPLYHIYALNLHALSAFSCGGHNVMVPNARDLGSIVNIMKKFRITVFVGVNTLFNALCRNPNFALLDFSSLVITASGGMALTTETAKKWFETTGCRVCEGYGLTETSPVVAGNKPANIHPGSIGSLVPETEAKIIDDDGNVVPKGESGELCLKGPQVMKGYWHRDEETAMVLSADGWLKTGDIAVECDDGFIKIVDRKKDMIVVSGFNVYPNEIEDIVCLMPDVVEAAAIGVADENCGEIVKLFVVSSSPDLTPQQIRAFCKTKLTAYKVPKIVDFRDSLPKSNVGKVLRKELRGL